MTFAMAIARRPISNKKTNPKYAEAIKESAQLWITSKPMLDGELYARIIWFHSGSTDQDVDNIVKRILDPLQKVVFDNDKLISQCLSVSINTRKDYIMSDKNVLPDVYNELLKLLGEDHGNVLYIEIGHITSPRVMFGPIDGGI